MKKRKILIYTMTMNTGGTERVISNISNRFINDYDITIVTNIKCDCAFRLSKKIKIINIDDYDKTKESYLKKIKTKISHKRTKKLKQIILDETPNLIISFLPEPQIRMLSLKKFFNIPMIIAVRNNPKNEFAFPFGKMIRNHYYKNADKIILQSKYFMDYFPKKFNDKIVVISNMIENKITNTKTKKEKIIINAGRLENQKNQKLLIKAFSKLDERFKDYKLVIYGEGSKKKELNKLINKLNLTKRISIKNNTNKIMEKIKNSQLFVLSSNYEGMPNALLEALYVKTPVVSTNSSPIVKELIKDERYITKVKNIKDLTKKMEYALLNQEVPKLRINNDTIYKKWEKIFEIKPKRKNIMMLISSLSNGGAERACSNITNALNKNNNVIMVISNDKIRDYNITVPVFVVEDLRSRRRRIIGLWQVRKLKKKYRIDTCISFTTMYNFYNIASRYKEKTVISIRNHLSSKNEKIYHKIMHMISCIKANLIVNVAEAVKIDQHKNFKVPNKKMITITNFCEIPKLRKLAMEKIENKNVELFNSKSVISIARLEPHKGHQHIIRAFTKVVKYDKDCKLFILGRGPLKEYLEQLIIDLHLEKNVYLLGFDSNPYKYIDKASIFVLASRYEGFSNALVEAMALKKPVISTDAEGVTIEILSNTLDLETEIKKTEECEYGIITPKCKGDTPNSKVPLSKEEIYLADSIILLLKNNEKYEYYSKSAFNRVKKYNKDIIIQKWNNIL